MSFAVAWNMAVALIEQRAEDFRQMWMNYVHEDRVEMPALQQRLQASVEKAACRHTEGVLRRILQETLPLHPLPESDEQSFFRGVAAVEKIIESALSDVAPQNAEPEEKSNELAGSTE